MLSPDRQAQIEYQEVYNHCSDMARRFIEEGIAWRDPCVSVWTRVSECYKTLIGLLSSECSKSPGVFDYRCQFLCHLAFTCHEPFFAKAESEYVSVPSVGDELFGNILVKRGLRNRLFKYGLRFRLFGEAADLLPARRADAMRARLVQLRGGWTRPRKEDG